MAALSNPLAADLDHVLEQTTALWDDFRGQRVFITGGTGFFGCWLLETLLWANDNLNLGVSVALLARNPGQLEAKAPHLAMHPAVTLYAGDVRTFDFPEEPFAYAVHAATASASTLAKDDPSLMFDTIVTGTRRVLDFATRAGVRRFLLTSSGAVYGRQPADLSHVPEDYSGGPEITPDSAYAEGKRAAEMWCALYTHQRGLHTAIARGFAFVGPYLPLDAHFAIGNFVRDGLTGGTIRIKGDGTPYRSYLYGTDLAVWLWTILLRGQSGRPYNVGSPAAVTISELAELVANAFTPPRSIEHAKSPMPGVPASRYVPDVRRADDELGLKVTVSLDDAIRRTIGWHEHRRCCISAVN